MSAQPLFTLRPLRDDDRSEYVDLLFSAFNTWYWKHGLGMDFYQCEPHETRIFYDIYSDISPGGSVAAFHKATDSLFLPSP